MILATILESIPWCHLVSRHSTPGFLTQDPLHLHPIYSVSSSFRILVTFAIVLEARGISFFRVPWTAYGRSSFEPKDHNKSAHDEFSIRDSASSTFLRGLSGRNLLSFTQHTNQCIHNSERYLFLEMSPFSCYPTVVCQLIVRSSCAFVLSMLIILVVHQAILFQND